MISFMEKKIIIIEDEIEIADAIGDYLQKHGFISVKFPDAESFYSNKSKPMRAIYLVDWNLPGVNGLDVIKRLREGDKFSPIFMITANSTPENMLEGLKAGADDYITKPFNFENLLARVQNSWQKYSTLSKDLFSEGMKLLPEAHSLLKDGVTVNLTSREFIIFKHLHDSKNTVSRDEIIKQFTSDDDMTLRNIDVHIFSLRKKLKKVGITIATVWGAGYKLDQDS